MMNRKVFFDFVRLSLFGGGLTPSQVDGLTKILDEGEARRLADLRWLAYILATAFHETGRKMQPIAEGGGDTYLQSKKYYPWYGRGLVQITWKANYQKFGIAIPGDALSWPTALKVLFDGMTEGKFTGSALGHWFSPTVDDPVNARRIVNETDRAIDVAAYHKSFLAALKASATVPPVPPSGPVVIPRPVAPPHLPAPKPEPTGWRRFLGFFTRKVS